MVYFPLGTPSKTSKASSDMHWHLGETGLAMQSTSRKAYTSREVNFKGKDANVLWSLETINVLEHGDRDAVSV